MGFTEVLVTEKPTNSGLDKNVFVFPYTVLAVGGCFHRFCGSAMLALWAGISAGLLLPHVCKMVAGAPDISKH